MVDYQNLLANIDALYNQKSDLKLVPAPSHFPSTYTTAYDGQQVAVQKLMASKDCLLSSHTGSGKTIVFLSAAKALGEATMVIEPKKFLQAQVSTYYNDVVIYGKSHYPCNYADTASNAPCLMKQMDDEGKRCFYVFDHKTDSFNVKKYPCPDCKYIENMGIAKHALHQNDVIITNFGNFWSFLKAAKVIIIDEADAFYKSIMVGTKLKYTEKLLDTVQKTLENELYFIDKKIEELSKKSPRDHQEQNFIAKEYNNVRDKRDKLKFFGEHIDMCFQYEHENYKTKEKDFYVELNPKYTEILKEKIFANKIVWTVTATPSDFKSTENVINYSVPQRTRVFYTPISLMTSNYCFTKNNQHVFKDCADFIINMNSVFTSLYKSDKAIIHTGNLLHHAKELMEYMPKDKCLVHSSGKLLETVEEFRKSDKRFLLIVGADHGLDLSGINHQFILKVPFASEDDRMKEIKKQMTAEEFSFFYNMDAINRLVQSSGRAGRGADSFGCTFIMDRKFREVYFKFKNYLPAWFLEKLDDNVY
jgi:hypothetical protein